MASKTIPSLAKRDRASASSVFGDKCSQEPDRPQPKSEPRPAVNGE